MQSQIVIPESGNIAANRGSEDACAAQFGGETPALRESFVENRSVKRDVRLPRRQVPARNWHFDERSGHCPHSDFQNASAVDHFSSCDSLPPSVSLARRTRN